MTKIYKYSVPAIGINTIRMPTFAKILTFQLQNNVPTVWVQVDENKINEDRQVLIIGTGHDFPDHIDLDYMQYIGTIQKSNGLVWHLYDLYNWDC